MSDATHGRPLAIGVLGAARIAPMALIRPARELPSVTVGAVAARDARRARRFAKRHGIAKVHESYEALIADRAIDAIYNPLPNSFHAEWTIRALEAGKHVLCEKPLASNAEEAERMAAAAEATGRVLMEAFHWRYHPLAERLRAIVTSGALGTVRHVEATMCIPLPLPGDIRWRLDLAGGSVMDVGCYTLSLVRFLAGAEPEVLSASAKLARPGIDRWMRAELRFPGGVTGRITCALLSARLVDISARVDGDAGILRVLNPVAPHIFHRVTVEDASGRHRERVPGRATYTHQLEAFAAAVRGEGGVITDARHGVANMRAIDAVYRAAGLAPRGGDGRPDPLRCPP